MLFSSSYFLILFLPMMMIVYKLGRNNITYKNAVLLIFSVFFYAWGEPFFVFIILLSICLNYLFGLIIGTNSSYKKPVMILSLAVNIGMLFVMKYLSFVSGVFSGIFGNKVLEIALPIGISFYTFQIMSYIFDVYYGNAKSQKNLFYLALYILMFPQLIAGPIVRYNSIEEEISHRVETFDDFEEGIGRFIIGLSKKVLIADFLGGIADKIFSMSDNGNITTVAAWLGALTYIYELYFDFSGYSDMAIGLGKCMGFNFLENFNYPMVSKNITEFWRRWHLSLTQWFRDYVYIPLGGNRVKPARHVFNLLIVWLLTGIWHGAQWTFIVWGITFFVIQMIEKYTGFTEKIPAFLGRVYTMITLLIVFVLFRSSNLACGMHYYTEMFSVKYGFCDDVTAMILKGSLVIVPIGIIGATPWLPKLRKCVDNCENAGLKVAVQAAGFILLVSLLIISVFMVINGNYSPFIYFNF